jgi:hypothetical protein
MKKVIIFMSIFAIACTNNPKAIKSTDWIMYMEKDSIPKNVIKKLSELEKSPFVLANPTDKFNSTDVKDKELPDKRLNFIAVHKNKDYRLSYVQGGFGKYNVLIEFSIQKDSIFNLRKIETLMNLQNMEEIDKNINSGKLKWKSIK